MSTLPECHPIPTDTRGATLLLSFHLCLLTTLGGKKAHLLKASPHVLTGIKANESTDVPSVARTVLLHGLRKCRLARVKRLRALILDFMERIMEPRPRLSDELHLFSGMTFLSWQKVLLVKLPIILTWVIWWDVRLILEIWILLDQRSVKQHYTSTCSWDFIVNIRLSRSTISNLI